MATDAGAADGMIEVVNLLSAEGLRRIVEGFVTDFTGFAPLGVVLVALLGVAVAERARGRGGQWPPRASA